LPQPPPLPHFEDMSAALRYDPTLTVARQYVMRWRRHIDAERAEDNERRKRQVSFC
jgi:hypothetical protein